jgi:hypothetical protein
MTLSGDYTFSSYFVKDNREKSRAIAGIMLSQTGF